MPVESTGAAVRTESESDGGSWLLDVVTVQSGVHQGGAAGLTKVGVCHGAGQEASTGAHATVELPRQCRNRDAAQ